MKLTKSDRETIYRKIKEKIANQFDPEIEHKLANRLRLAFFGEHLAAYESLPGHLRGESGHIQAVLKRPYDTKRFCNRHDIYLDFGQTLSMPTQASFDLAPFPELEREVRTFIKAKNENERRQDEAVALVKGLVEAAGTTQQLLTRWPDSEEFLPARREKPSLPAIPVERLNQIINPH